MEARRAIAADRLCSERLHASNGIAFADMEARRAIAADRLCSERLIDTARCNIQHRVN
jgi:hypothetical protein